MTAGVNEFGITLDCPLISQYPFFFSALKHLLEHLPSVDHVPVQVFSYLSSTVIPVNMAAGIQGKTSSGDQFTKHLFAGDKI